ncbi:MAG: transposase [Mycobacterium sp.]
MLTDINSLRVAVGVSSAQPHDARGGWALLETAKPQLTRLTTVFADAAYIGLVARADAELGVTVDIRRRPAGTHWFVPLQPWWRVERTFAWLGRNRRLRHDYEATVTSSQTFVHAAATAVMHGKALGAFMGLAVENCPPDCARHGPSRSRRRHRTVSEMGHKAAVGAR